VSVFILGYNDCGSNPCLPKTLQSVNRDCGGVSVGETDLWSWMESSFFRGPKYNCGADSS